MRGEFELQDDGMQRRGRRGGSERWVVQRVGFADVARAVLLAQQVLDIDSVVQPEAVAQDVEQLEHGQPWV